MENKIIPGKGFGKIKFGMTEDEVIDILGKPDEIEVQEMDDNEVVNVYYYDDMGVSLSFDSLEDFRLVEFSFDDNVYTLENNFYPGMSRELFLEHANELGEYSVEDFSEEDTDVNELYAFEDKNINIWITDGVVDTIQIGPFWNDDDNVNWPD
ncbi:MAG: hypothetical protein GXO47_01480 [Chlorobi bacterium]|nr:hypothetical protein [Chlorobiota bacterium]